MLRLSRFLSRFETQDIMTQPLFNHSSFFLAAESYVLIFKPYNLGIYRLLIKKRERWTYDFFSLLFFISFSCCPALLLYTYISYENKVSKYNGRLIIFFFLIFTGRPILFYTCFHYESEIQVQAHQALLFFINFFHCLMSRCYKR